MKSTTAWLCTAVVVGALLRLWQAGESLWLDELHTSWTVSGSLSEVTERAAIGNQSPLYFWLAWFFARLPVLPEIALRIPSVLAGCALPVAVFWLAKKLLPTQEDKQDNTVPLLAAWLVAVDPLAIFYSQEARPYALLMLVAVVHIGQLLRTLERDDWQSRTLWVITGALLVHLNYTGGLILLAEFVALALFAISTARQPACQIPTNNLSQDRPLQMCWSCWIDIVALLVLLLPAIPGMLAVTERRNNWESFVKPQPFYELLRMFPFTPAMIILIVLNSWRSVISQRNLVLLSCWLLVPLGITWVTTQLHVLPLFFPRYLIAALPASLLAAAICVRLSANVASQSALVGVILAVAVANGGLVQNVWRHGRLLPDRQADWRGAVAALNSQLAADASRSTPVLVRSGLIEADAPPKNHNPLFHDYCLLPVRGMYRLQTDDVFPLTSKDPGKISPALRNRLSGESSLWLLAHSSVHEQLLIDLRESLEDEEIWLPEMPLLFGSLALQRVQLRKSLPADGR